VGTLRAVFGQEFLENGCNLLQYKEITRDQSAKNGSKNGDYKQETRFSKNYSCPRKFRVLETKFANYCRRYLRVKVLL